MSGGRFSTRAAGNNRDSIERATLRQYEGDVIYIQKGVKSIMAMSILIVKCHHRIATREMAISARRGKRTVVKIRRANSEPPREEINARCWGIWYGRIGKD